jgi:plasmid stabilization system protein ParE
MDNHLIWNERSADEYDRLFEYLLDEWGDNIALKIIYEIDQKINSIRELPEIFPVFVKRKKIRRCVASAQTSIYFKVVHHNIEIIAIIDNRRNPKKRKL